MVHEDLQSLGLSDKEASVYLAALELGSDTVQRIAQKAKVKRVTTYVVLQTLLKKGLVSKIDKGKKTLFVAEEPERLSRFIDQQILDLSQRKNSLKGLVRELRLINNISPNKPTVRFFEGREGVDTLISDFYKEFKTEQKKPKQDRAKLYLAYSRDLLSMHFPPDEITKNRNVRLEAGVEAIALYNAKERYEESKMSTSHRVPENEFPFPCDIAIFKDKIRLISLKAEPTAILIIDADLARGLESLFRLAAEAASRHK